MAAKSSDWRPGPTVCRCCLSEGCYKDISTEYFWMGKREVYSEMLADTFDVSISYSKSGGPNSQSRLICEPCIARLRDAADFKRQVQECEKTFVNCLDPATALNDLQASLELEKEVKVEMVMKEEKRHSDDDDFGDAPDFGDDDDYDDLDDQPLTKLASKIPKKETVDVLDLLDNAKITEKRKSSSKHKSQPSKKVKTKQIAGSSKEKPEPKKKKGTVKKYVWKRRRRVYNDHRHNAAIIIEYSNVCPFRWKRGAFTCSHCPRTFGHFDDLYNHTQEHSDSLMAMQYARPYDTIKVEVTSLKCTICHDKMNDLDHLRDHLYKSHQKPITMELDIGVTPFILRSNEMICAHCSQCFSLFSKLNSHMNEHYPNNICSHCGKAFTAAHRLKAHQLTHESGQAQDQTHKCTKCDEFFETKLLRNYHINKKHAPENRYRCPYCNLSFKRYSERSRHLKEFHNQNVEYPCHLCPAIFSLCEQRTKHIRNVHIKHKQFQCDRCPSKFVTAGQLKSHMVKHTGSREFQCGVCKKSYARSRTLNEHMRIHNNDRRFVCEYCNNAFVQKCSLKSHMKTHHPNAEISKISID